MVVGMGDSAHLSGTGWEERRQLEVQAHCDLPLGCHKTYILIFVSHPLGHVTRAFLWARPFNKLPRCFFRNGWVPLYLSLGK